VARVYGLNIYSWNKPMPRIQFHLLSIIVTMFTASGVLWLNCIDRKYENHNGPTVLYGWPETAVYGLDAERLARWGESKLGGSISRSGRDVVSVKNGKITVHHPYTYDPKSIVLDTIIGLLVCAFAFGACEFLIFWHNNAKEITGP